MKKLIIIAILISSFSSYANSISDMSLSVSARNDANNQALNCLVNETSEFLGAEFKFISFSNAALFPQSNNKLAMQGLLYQNTSSGKYFFYEIMLRASQGTTWKYTVRNGLNAIYAKSVEPIAIMTIANVYNPPRYTMDYSQCASN